ncbi:MAG TPA: hypothetical protein VH684_18110 [Xanthobacteraceae bacterium]
MSRCCFLLALALAAGMLTPLGGAAAFDDSRYPDLSGQWHRLPTPGVRGQPSFDPTRPWGRGQQAPLTPEYQAKFEASLADQAAGGHGAQRGWSCRTSGMPLMMTLFEPMEIIVLPETTYIRIDQYNTQRRIFTDGRNWPHEIEASYNGYSVGRWIDDDGDGRFDALEVETRGFKGPSTVDASGIPLHHEGRTVIKERFYLDKVRADVLHDQITVIDDALTRPWTVTKNYRRDPDPQPVWIEWVCAEGQSHVAVGKENYYLSADGLLMPTRKDQPPPDLRYFKQPAK